MYSDSDYASDTDNRKSTSGIVCKYADSAISRMSKLQQCISLSTSEAEFIAASETEREVIWSSKLFEDITLVKEPPIIHIDNQSAIKVNRNPELHYIAQSILMHVIVLRESNTIKVTLILPIHVLIIRLRISSQKLC